MLMTNVQIRARLGIIFQETKKPAGNIFNHDATTSKNVAKDLFDYSGAHHNRVNTCEAKETEE